MTLLLLPPQLARGIDEPVLMSKYLTPEGIWRCRIGDWDRPIISGAAIAGSGFYQGNWVKQINGTDTIIDWVNDAVKIALWGNTANTALTPDYDAAPVYGAGIYASGEITGTGYTAAGLALAAKTATVASGIINMDCNDPQWTGASFTGARAGVYHDVTIALLLALQYFGAGYDVSAGNFTIQQPVGGPFGNDGVP